ncbi:type II toxin-antitoxin system ParD family antitoxin, partial [bacterium]
LFELEESKNAELVKALKKGEKSGFIENFDRDENLKNLHKNYLSNE